MMHLVTLKNWTETDILDTVENGIHIKKLS